MPRTLPKFAVGGWGSVRILGFPFFLNLKHELEVEQFYAKLPNFGPSKMEFEILGRFWG